MPTPTISDRFHAALQALQGKETDNTALQAQVDKLTSENTTLTNQNAAILAQDSDLNTKLAEVGELTQLGTDLTTLEGLVGL